MPPAAAAGDAWALDAVRNGCLRFIGRFAPLAHALGNGAPGPNDCGPAAGSDLLIF
jgi:hypothetical protein